MGEVTKYNAKIDHKVQKVTTSLLNNNEVKNRIHAEYVLNTFDCIKLATDEMSTC